MDTLEVMIESEQESMGRYLVQRTRELVELSAKKDRVNDALSIIGTMAQDEGHNAYGYISGKRVYVYVRGLTSFGQVAEYLRRARYWIKEPISNRDRNELDYSCNVGPLHLSFSVNGENATCRRVQVGTRTEEVPVYEVVCDDKSEEAAISQVVTEGE